MAAQRAAPSPSVASAAFRFVLVLGIVNLFADTTYEGGASINGQFLGTLGASAAIISIVAGVGEFLGAARGLPLRRPPHVIRPWA
jgi:hypothetical protein